jgi:hypothetical protein
MKRGGFKLAVIFVGALMALIAFIGGLVEVLGKSALWLLAAGLLWLVGMIISGQIKRRRLFRNKGYEVNYEIVGNDARRFVYRERFDGGVRELRLPAELIENGHPVYYQVSQEIWARTVPEWARERRLEIEGRILEDPFYRPEEL